MATGSKVTVRLITIPATPQGAPAAESTIVAGDLYQIVSLGTSVFTQYGAPENIVGLTFTASKNAVVSPGTGTVILLSFNGELEFNSLVAVPFTYDSNWNSTADEQLSSSGILPLINVIGSPPLGNSSTGDAGINCQVRVEDYYSFDTPNLLPPNGPGAGPSGKLDAYDVTFTFGLGTIPATSQTLDWWISAAESAINTVIAAPSTYNAGGGVPIVGPTGPHVLTVI